MKSDDVSSEAILAMQVVADNISQARKARNLSQEEVAKACNLGVGTYSAVEKGSVAPGIKAYIKVLDYFGTTTSLFFLGAPQFDSLGRTLRRG